MAPRQEIQPTSRLRPARRRLIPIAWNQDAANSGTRSGAASSKGKIPAPTRTMIRLSSTRFGSDSAKAQTRAPKRQQTASMRLELSADCGRFQTRRIQDPTAAPTKKPMEPPRLFSRL